MKRVFVALEYQVCFLFLTIIAMMALSPAPQQKGDIKVSWIHTPLFWIVLIGGGLIIAQTWANYWKQWYDPKWIIYFADRFNSKDMLNTRSEACVYFKSNKKWNDQVDDVLDVMDDIGFNVEHDVISREVAHHYLDYWIRNYLELTRSYRDDVRGSSRKVNVWNHCDYLLHEVNKVERKTNSAPLKLDDEDIAEFVDEEISLKQPLQGLGTEASPH
jgi:hypothetical protein